MMEETAKEQIARHRNAVAGLSWDEDGIRQAATQALDDFWPDRDPQGITRDFADGILNCEGVAYGLAAIRRAGTWVPRREAFPCPCANPYHHEAREAYQHPDVEADAWPNLLASAYGIAEVAILRLRSYERDDNDPETGLPLAWLRRYNLAAAAREGGV